MFEFVRSHTRLFQGLLVLLIFPSFVFFGVQGYSSFTDAKTATVAVVAGHAIHANELEVAHRQQIDRMRAQMPELDVKLLDSPQFRKETLEGMVRERVLSTAISKEMMVVPDARLARLFAGDPQLASLRNPDGSVNKDFLAARGMSSVQFAEQLRQDYALRQLVNSVGGTSVAGKKLGDAAAQALLDQREIQVQLFEVAAYLPKVQASDADVENYYKAHADSFRAQEEAKVEFVVLDLESLRKDLNLGEEDLRKYYSENLARYTSAEERRASHILINAGAGTSSADKAKAKEKAEALLAEVRKSPAAFAEIAKTNSQDEGSAAKGGDLDFFGRGAMTKPFEDAVFAMKAGEISAVVESEFGFHIIKLNEVRGGIAKPFEAVRAQIMEEVGRNLAQKKFVEVAEQFSNTVYEQSDSLQPVIDKFKLSKSTATVYRTAAPGAKGPMASAKLLEAIFSADSVKNRRNTEAVETAPNQLVSARIVDYKPEQVQPLAEVRNAVLAQVKQEQASALAKQEAQARLTALQGADQALPKSVVVSRVEAAGLPRPVIEAALKADVAQKPVLQVVDLGKQGQAIVKVVRQVPRAPADPELARIRPTVLQALATAEAETYLSALRKRYKVEIKEAAIAAAIDKQ